MYLRQRDRMQLDHLPCFIGMKLILFQLVDVVMLLLDFGYLGKFYR